MGAASPSFFAPHSADHEPTAQLIRPGESCFAVVEVDVFGAVDEIWESVTTGPGRRRCFVEAKPGAAMAAGQVEQAWSTVLSALVQDGA